MIEERDKLVRKVNREMLSMVSANVHAFSFVLLSCETFSGDFFRLLRCAVFGSEYCCSVSRSITELT